MDHNVIDIRDRILHKRDTGVSDEETATEGDEGQLGELIHPFEKMQGRSRRPQVAKGEQQQNPDRMTRASIFVLPNPLTIESHDVDNGETTDDVLGVVALAQVVRLDDYRGPGDLAGIIRRRVKDFEARRQALRVGRKEVRWPKRKPHDTDIFDDWI